MFDDEIIISTLKPPLGQMVLWDFDGTLADTLTSGVSVYNDLAVVHGFNVITDPAALRDLKTREILQRLRIPLWKTPWLARKFVAQQKGMMPNIRLFQGIDRVLKSLRDSGISQGIVSSNSEESIRLCLRANDAEHYFDVIVGYAKLFGKHTAMQQMITHRSLQPQQILYVGDEVRDIEAARRVSIEVAAVTWGWHSSTLLSLQRPTYLINDPSELLELPRIRKLSSEST